MHTERGSFPCMHNCVLMCLGKDSAGRQIRASMKAIKTLGLDEQKPIIKKLVETISGMLPKAKRHRLMQLINGDAKYVVVESSRAIAH